MTPTVPSRSRITLGFLLLFAACGTGTSSGTPEELQGGPGAKDGSPADASSAGAGKDDMMGKEEAATRAMLPEATVYRVFLELDGLLDASPSCFSFPSMESPTWYHLTLGSFYQLPNGYRFQEVLRGQLAVSEWALVDWAGRPTLLVPPLSINWFAPVNLIQANAPCARHPEVMVEPGQFHFNGGGLPLSSTGAFAGFGREVLSGSRCAEETANGDIFRTDKTQAAIRKPLTLQTDGFAPGVDRFTGTLTLGRQIECEPGRWKDCPSAKTSCGLTLKFWADRVTAQP